MPFGHPYGAFGKTSSNRFGGEVRAALTFLRLKISKPSYRFVGHIDADVFRRSVRVAGEGCHASGVEDPIKITTGSFGSIGELVTGRLDLCAGIIRLLQPFCSFVRLFEQHGVMLCSSGALGNKPERAGSRPFSGPWRG
jgi:hypothetical protein